MSPCQDTTNLFQGHTDAVRELVLGVKSDGQALLGCGDDQGCLPLHYAAREGHDETITCLWTLTEVGPHAACVCVCVCVSVCVCVRVCVCVCVSEK
jgi:hypothetical protein